MDRRKGVLTYVRGIDTPVEQPSLGLYVHRVHLSAQDGSLEIAASTDSPNLYKLPLEKCIIKSVTHPDGSVLTFASDDREQIKARLTLEEILSMKAGAYTMGPRRVAIEYYVTPNATLGDKGIVTSFLPATTQNPTDDLVIRRWLGGTLSANAEWLKAGRARVVKVAIVPTNSTTTTTEREFPRTEEGTAQAFKWIRRLLETFSDRDKEELRGWKRQTTSVSSYLSSPRPAYYRVAGDERGSKIFRDQLKAQKGILTPLPPPEESSKKKEWINSRYEYF